MDMEKLFVVNLWMHFTCIFLALEELLGKRRKDLLQQKRRFEQNAEAQKAVEQRVRDSWPS